MNNLEIERNLTEQEEEVIVNNKNTIIITEKKTNLLNTFARKKKILHINHKDYIGGRYSVLSEVGIIPAYFMKLKINNFKLCLILSIYSLVLLASLFIYFNYSNYNFYIGEAITKS